MMLFAKAALACVSLAAVAGRLAQAESFDVNFYPSAANNASQCIDNSATVVETFELGCQTVFGDTIQFDCTEDHKLRLTLNYADSSCSQEGTGGYQETVIERDCMTLEAGALLDLLTDDARVPKGSSGVSGYTTLPHSPCLTEFEEFEQMLGMELLDIFGLNNITNSSDPVLYEVKEVLFSYGIVFVAVMIFLGFMLCICGYKFFWLTLFASGFAILGYLTYFAWMQVTLALDVDVAIVAKGILPSFLVGGIIGGILAWRFLKLGIFVLGATFGGALGYLLYMSVIQSFWNESWGLYVIVGCCGLLFGIIFIFKHKFFIVVCSALIGSFALVSGVSFCIGYYPDLTDIETVETDVNAVTWQFWVFFASFGAVMVCSIIIQQCIKKKDKQKKYRDHSGSQTGTEMAEQNPFKK